MGRGAGRSWLSWERSRRRLARSGLGSGVGALDLAGRPPLTVALELAAVVEVGGDEAPRDAGRAHGGDVGQDLALVGVGPPVRLGATRVPDLGEFAAPAAGHAQTDHRPFVGGDGAEHLTDERAGRI